MLAEKLRKIYELVGELTTCVSDIDLAWYLLFTCLMHQTPRELTDAIINVHKTGEGQRQTIMAVVAAIFDETSDERKFIAQLKAKCDELSGRRNAAVHSVIDIADYTEPPRIIAAGTSKRSKLAEHPDIEAELIDCIKSAKELVGYLQGFMSALDTYGAAPLALKHPRPRAGWTSPL